MTTIGENSIKFIDEDKRALSSIDLNSLKLDTDQSICHKKKENIEVYESLSTYGDTSTLYFVLNENDPSRLTTKSTLPKQISSSSIGYRRPPPPPPPRIIGSSLSRTGSVPSSPLTKALPVINTFVKSYNAPLIPALQEISKQSFKIAPPLPTQPPPPIPRHRVAPQPPVIAVDLEDRFSFLPFPNLASLPRAFEPPLDRVYPSARSTELGKISQTDTKA